MRDALVFFFNDTATTEIYTLSLHDALPISGHVIFREGDESDTCYVVAGGHARALREHGDGRTIALARFGDRKSTRLNSSHANISYAVFCLKKKNNLPTQPAL